VFGINNGNKDEDDNKNYCWLLPNFQNFEQN